MNVNKAMLVAYLALFHFGDTTAVSDPALPTKFSTMEELQKQHPMKTGLTIVNHLMSADEHPIVATVIGYIATDSTMVIFLTQLPGGNKLKEKEVKILGRVWECKSKDPSEADFKKAVRSLRKEMVFDFFGASKDDFDRTKGPEPAPPEGKK
jgi:hypothetical protein